MHTEGTAVMHFKNTFLKKISASLFLFSTDYNILGGKKSQKKKKISLISAVFSFNSAVSTPSKSDTDTQIRHTAEYTANHHMERNLTEKLGINPGDSPSL